VARKDQPAAAEVQEDIDFSVGNYIVAKYDEGWFLGQILSKEEEPGADPGDQYVYVSYMERVGVQQVKWPARPDLLNTLKSDVYFGCDPPVPSAGSSSSRMLFTMDKKVVIRAADAHSKVPLIFRKRVLLIQLYRYRY